MTETHKEHDLIRHLVKLKKSEDRATLAALRSGIGKKPGEAARMFPHVAPFLGQDAPAGPYVQTVFMTAALFASHPEHGHVGNLGASLRSAVKAKHGEDGVAARLTATLDADAEDLPYHLSGLVSLCASAGVPIDWNSFFWDVYRLLGDDDDKRNSTRLNWAKGFWGATLQSDSNDTNEETQP